jgi:hypothetical protein
MSDGPPTFRQYGVAVPASCGHCGVRIKATDPAWFVSAGDGKGAVFCWEPACRKAACRYGVGTYGRRP